MNSNDESFGYRVMLKTTLITCAVVDPVGKPSSQSNLIVNEFTNVQSERRLSKVRCPMCCLLL